MPRSKSPRKKVYTKKVEKKFTLEKKITLSNDFVKKQEVQQLHKNVKPIHHYFPIYADHKNEIWQTDLLDLSNISKYNQMYRYILLFIDVYSRFVYAVPLKNKMASTVNEALKNVLSIAKPELIQADYGSEFINKTFKKILSENNTNIQFLQTSHQLGIINRFCRTIRNLIEKYLTAYHTNNYISVLDKIIKNYNTSFHKGIQSIPSKPNNEKISEINYKKLLEAQEEETKFELGDTVRYILNRQAFEKGTLPRFSSTLHTIMDKNIHSYKLDNGKWYMYYELQPANEVQIKEKTTEPSREHIRKENKRQRILTKEGIETKNILSHPEN